VTHFLLSWSGDTVLHTQHSCNKLQLQIVSRTRRRIQEGNLNSTPSHIKEKKYKPSTSSWSYL
jgi:hypothetical protein